MLAGQLSGHLLHSLHAVHQTGYFPINQFGVACGVGIGRIQLGGAPEIACGQLPLLECLAINFHRSPDRLFGGTQSLAHTAAFKVGVENLKKITFRQCRLGLMDRPVACGHGGITLIEDRLRGLKLRLPVDGLRIKLVPAADELEDCRNLGESLARHLTGQVEHREIDMASLA